MQIDTQTNGLTPKIWDVKKGKQQEPSAGVDHTITAQNYQKNQNWGFRVPRPQKGVCQKNESTYFHRNLILSNFVFMV